MKKMTRKLIPALAMLLISAVMMSTASFAWFSMNTQVTATGMSVTAVAPKSLWITDTNSLEGLTHTVGLVNDVESAQPKFVPVKDTFTAATGAVTFEKLTQNGSQKVNANGQIVDGNESDYEATAVDHFHDTIYLQLTGDAGVAQKIGVQATIASTESTPDDIYKAIKVLLVVKEGEVYKSLELDFESLSTDNATAQVLITALAPNAAAPTAVDVYTFIDGEDTDCKNANAYNSHVFTISLSFTIVETGTGA